MILATWNMQGGVNTVYLPTVIRRANANVICLQECGDFSSHMHNLQPILNGNGATLGYTGLYRHGEAVMECVFWENPTWVQGGVAVLTNLPISAYGILTAAAVPGFVPNNVRDLPWVTVNDPGGPAITVYSIHGPPVFGATTIAQTCAWDNAQITQINAAGGTWACIGDFNADPTQAGYVAPPAGAVVRGHRATQQGHGLLDYAVTNAAGFAYSDHEHRHGSSDHYPQVFTW